MPVNQTITLKSLRVFFLTFKIITEREEGSPGLASKPLGGIGEWGVVSLAKGVSPSGSSPAGHCAANVPALVTSNQEGSRPSLIKKENLGKTGAD